MAETVTTGLQKLQINNYAPKIAPGKAGTPAQVRTNSIELSLTPNLPIFKYDLRMHEIVTKKDGSKKELELCKQTSDDFTEQVRKAKTVMILKYLCETKKLPLSLDQAVYDRAAILFSIKKFSQLEIILSLEDLKKIQGYSIDQNLIEVRVTVKPVTEEFQLSSNDISSKSESKEILEFLNIATSQFAFMSPSFITYGTNKPFLLDPSTAGFQERDLPQLGEGKYLGVGGSKTVKLLEGSGSKSVPVLTLDVNKAAFHTDNMPAHEKIASLLDCQIGDLPRFLQDPNNRKMVLRGIKGLKFETNYLERNSVFTAKTLAAPANQSKFRIDGKEISVQEYFQSKYKKVLKFPNLPVIQSAREAFYPMELVVVAPNQRVTFDQQTPQQMKIQIRSCATAPSIRLRQGEQISKSLSLAPGTQNKHLASNGISIKQPLTVPGRVLPLPTVRDKRNSPAIVGNAKWSDDGFIFPATIEKWACFGLLSNQDSRKENMIEALLTALMSIGRQNGMTFEKYEYKRVDPNNIERAFAEAAKEGIKFILFVQSDSLHCHDIIKALEQQYQVLTQDLKFSKCFETGKRDTMKNIVQKTNMKNGGVNHIVLDCGKQLEKSVLILGIEFSHPPPQTDSKREPPSMPSVLGFSSNCTKQHQVFVGDYRYIEARTSDDQSSIAQIMKEIFVEAITRFKKNRQGAPGLVIIYRNGASEGQYPILLNEEIPLFAQTCHEMSGGRYKPELVMIAVNKDHQHRIYRPNPGQGKPSEQNITPGTIVDKGIVSANRNEFYLSSHSAFQGTSKAPKYTIIKNGTSKGDLLSMDTLQQITYALCFAHGIVSMTISLPVVLKVAGESAKRGANNYKIKFGDNSSSGTGPANLESANRELTYSSKPLSEYRFNS